MASVASLALTWEFLITVIVAYNIRSTSSEEELGNERSANFCGFSDDSGLPSLLESDHPLYLLLSVIVSRSVWVQHFLADSSLLIF